MTTSVFGHYESQMKRHFSPILQVRKLRFRKVNNLPKKHDFNLNRENIYLGVLAPKPLLWPECLCFPLPQLLLKLNSQGDELEGGASEGN
jgi:hypothetical protein